MLNLKIAFSKIPNILNETNQSNPKFFNQKIGLQLQALVGAT